ncbi:S1 RNA-binding domain-containing protein [Thermoproteota archaeon]
MENQEKDNQESRKFINQAEPSDIPKGTIVEGQITHITNFGAFVRVEGGEEGLVHISEVANEYVTDINKHVKVGDKIQVKALGRNNRGKLELSIRKVETGEPTPALFIHKKTSNSDFEDKITGFMKRSEEKLIDIRRNLKNKQGLGKKKR